MCGKGQSTCSKPTAGTHDSVHTAAADDNKTLYTSAKRRPHDEPRPTRQSVRADIMINKWWSSAPQILLYRRVGLRVGRARYRFFTERGSRDWFTTLGFTHTQHNTHTHKFQGPWNSKQQSGKNCCQKKQQEEDRMARPQHGRVVLRCWHVLYVNGPFFVEPLSLSLSLSLSLCVCVCLVSPSLVGRLISLIM